MRRLIAYRCEGATCLGTLDEAAGTVGLLIVSGGNEIRSGAHRGQAALAAAVAEAGWPVFRYDRRGVGDSEGENGGFESAAPDLAAAVAAFRGHAPHVTRIVGFGNCDAASTLALFGARAGVDALVLGNPWVVESDVADDLPPPAAIRARYAERLRDPAEWRRLLTGGVNLGKLARGLLRLAPGGKGVAAGLAERMAHALGAFTGPARVVLAGGDNTALAFVDAWATPSYADLRGRITVLRIDSDSHSFAGMGDAAWLRERVIEALDEAARRPA